MSVGDSIRVGNTVGNTIGSFLKVSNGRLCFVGVNVELDEQEQVTGQDSTSKQGSGLSPSTVSEVRQLPGTNGEPRVGYKSP